MVGKVGGLARALAIILAIIAGFVLIPNVNVALILVVLGLFAGLVYDEETTLRLFIVILVLPVVANALTNIPAVGVQLGAAAVNVALAASGAAATRIAMRLYQMVKGDLMGLAAK